MVPDGVGALYIAYEQLKRRLHQEGLFNKSAKKPLPAYPERIALVTSPTGAAVRDMLRILKKRWPLSRVLVCPVKVQGEGAAQQIAEMLDYLGQHQLADLVITGRGGGSLEDLWAFNEEAVARAIYRCPIPVISAVGHEPDITISDYVADLRAATPSNAAELAVPDGEELALRLGDTFSHLAYMEKKRIDALRQRLDTLASKKIMRSPEEYLNELRLALSIQQERMIAAARQLLGAKRRRFVQQAATLDALSPLKVLGRGYGFVTREGAIVKSADDLQAGDQIQIRLQGGRADCQVQQIQKEG